jgi:hypothetical protein
LNGRKGLQDGDFEKGWYIEEIYLDAVVTKEWWVY